MRKLKTDYDTLQQKCFATTNPDPSCSSPQVLAVYRETQELVQTADALLGNPSSGPGLGLDVEGLRFALRWTAAEEMAAQENCLTATLNNSSFPRRRESSA